MRVSGERDGSRRAPARGRAAAVDVAAAVLAARPRGSMAACRAVAGSVRRDRSTDRKRSPKRAAEAATAGGTRADLGCAAVAGCPAGVLGAAGAFTEAGAGASGERSLVDCVEYDRFDGFDDLVGCEDWRPWAGFGAFEDFAGFVLLVRFAGSETAFFRSPGATRSPAALAAPPGRSALGFDAATGADAASAHVARHSARTDRAWRALHSGDLTMS